jgi:hypothetical protein
MGREATSEATIQQNCLIQVGAMLATVNNKVYGYSPKGMREEEMYLHPNVSTATCP